MSQYLEINPALISAFQAAIPDHAGKVQYENGPVFDPAGKSVWFKLTCLENPADPVTLGDRGQDEITGVFQIDINTPLNSSTKANEIAMEKLRLFFTIGKPISYGSTVIRIERCGKSGASSESQGYWNSTISVFWTARINRQQIN